MPYQMKPMEAFERLEALDRDLGEYECDFNGEPLCKRAGADDRKFMLATFKKACVIMDAIETAMLYGVENSGTRKPCTMDEFMTWLFEMQDDCKSRMMGFAEEFVESQCRPVCQGCGSAECACIPVGDEQDATPEEFDISTVETWQVACRYRVKATSQERAEAQVRNNEVSYYRHEIGASEILELSVEE